MTSPPVAAPKVAASAATTLADAAANATNLTALTITDDAPQETQTTQEPTAAQESTASIGSDLTKRPEASSSTSPNPSVSVAAPADHEALAVAEPLPALGGDNNSATLPQPSIVEFPQMTTLNALAAYQPPGHDAVPAIPLTPTNGLPVLPIPDSLMPVASQSFEDTSSYVHDIDETRISAYAKLEFEDGEFYMNTYSVILGRDLAAARAALRRESDLQKQAADVEVREPKTPVRIKGEQSRYTRSVVSESGGILREDNDSDSDEHRRRKRKPSKKSKSTGSSSQHASRRNSLVQPEGFVEYQAQFPRHASETLGAVPVDPASLRPSPNDCPFVGIHPPAATGASGFKAISRQHVKIAYNSRRHLFETEIIGRNGAFVDDKFHFHNEIVPLKSGSRLQIGGVVVRFVLPDVAIGETGAEQEYEAATPAYSAGGKEMSFDFEDGPREGALMQDTSESESEAAVARGENDGDDDEEADEDERAPSGSELSEVEEEEEEEEEEDDEEDQDDAERGPEETPLPQPPKRRGPGRPPKNGIMSKREERLLKKEKEAQERAKMAPTDAPPVIKNKVGRPRKHPLPDTPPKTEKRKYTKRKPKDSDGIKQEGSDEEKKEKKTKPARAERSPTPTFNEADLTPEQLAKPQANYVTLIYEALAGSKTGSMSLPQIYRAIQRKYPFFVLRCNTNGWQSSVRHNLSQHHAFRKVQRDGKGWTWGIVEGVSIEKEKKRRATPPPTMMTPHPHQPIYRAGPYQQMMPGPPVQPGIPHPSVDRSVPQHIPQDPRYAAMPPPVPGYPLHRSSIPGPMQPAPQAPPQGSYSSPYARKPEAPNSLVKAPEAPLQHAQHPQHQPQLQQHHQIQQHQLQHQHQHQHQHQLQQPLQQLQQQRPIQHQHQHQQHMQHAAAARPPPPPSHQPSDHVSRAIEAFKSSLIGPLSKKTPDALAIVNSAIERVLGRSHHTAVPGNPHEDAIIAALRGILSKIPGSNIAPQPRPPAPPPSQSQHQPQQPQVHHQQAPSPAPPGPSPSPSPATPAITATAASVPRATAPAVQRPSFMMGSSRPPAPVPRPPMPELGRSNSGSPANPPTASISPSPAANGVASVESVAGTKRPLEEPSEMGDFKRMSTGPALKT